MRWFGTILLLATAAPAFAEFRVGGRFERIDIAMQDAGGLGRGFFSAQPVALGGGRLLAIYAASSEPGRLMITRSADGGEHWGTPATLVTGEANQKIGRAAAARARDGSIFVFYCGYFPDESKNGVWTIRGTDEGKSWSVPRKIWSGYAGTFQGALEADGAVILPFCYRGLPKPASFSGPYWIEAGVLLTRDSGKSWSLASPIRIAPPDDPIWKGMRISGGPGYPLLLRAWEVALP